MKIKSVFLFTLLFLQAGVIAGICFSFLSGIPLYIMLGVTLAVAVIVVGGRREKSYTVLWLFVVLLLPVFGSVVFLLYSGYGYRQVGFDPEGVPLFSDGDKNYLNSSLSGARVYPEEIKYIPDGNLYAEMLSDKIENAKRSIYLEFYIIADGIMWGKIYNKLYSAVKNGVKAEIIYDAIGSADRLPKKDLKTLKKLGVKVKAHGKALILTKNLNRRTHRKIALIDKKFLFLGGMNIGDEYLGESKFGEWKDSSVYAEGDFDFLPTFLKTKLKDKKGFTLPKGVDSGVFSGLLLDDATNGISAMEGLMLSSIYRADFSITLTTPYLVLSDRLSSAIATAVRRGVAVSVFIPEVPDKKFVYISTLDNAERLIKLGVKVYRFNGFLHSKLAVFDNKKAVVGSYNLDYRSMYLMKESALYFTGDEVNSVVNDIDRIKAKSTEMTLKKQTVSYKIKRAFVRIAEPLL